MKKWVCSEEGCGKRFKLQKELRYHLDMHKGTKNYTCELCERQFYKPFYLRNHKKHVHNWSGERWTCEICNKEFKTEIIMKFQQDEIHLKVKTRKGKKELKTMRKNK